MKKLLFIIMTSLIAGSAYAADVGVSVSVGQPGFYGQINIGSAPPPKLIYSKPIVIHPGPHRVAEEPIYLHVPPGHAKHWDKKCAKYNACGRPVYFVQESWYNNVYSPHYHQHQEEYHGKKHGDKHDHKKEKKHKKHKDKHDQ